MTSNSGETVSVSDDASCASLCCCCMGATGSSLGTWSHSELRRWCQVDHSTRMITLWAYGIHISMGTQPNDSWYKIMLHVNTGTRLRPATRVARRPCCCRYLYHSHRLSHHRHRSYLRPGANASKAMRQEFESGGNEGGND